MDHAIMPSFHPSSPAPLNSIEKTQEKHTFPLTIVHPTRLPSFTLLIRKLENPQLKHGLIKYFSLKTTTTNNNNNNNRSFWKIY